MAEVLPGRMTRVPIPPSQSGPVGTALKSLRNRWPDWVFDPGTIRARGDQTGHGIENPTFGLPKLRPNVSTFIARRGTIGGLRSIVRGLLPGFFLGAAGTAGTGAAGLLGGMIS